MRLDPGVQEHIEHKSQKLLPETRGQEDEKYTSDAEKIAYFFTHVYYRNLMTTDFPVSPKKMGRVEWFCAGVLMVRTMVVVSVAWIVRVVWAVVVVTVVGVVRTVVMVAVVRIVRVVWAVVVVTVVRIVRVRRTVVLVSIARVIRTAVLVVVWVVVLVIVWVVVAGVATSRT